MMNRDKIIKSGFCVISYNRIQYLHRCLDTLVSTTKHMSNALYFILDDCSSDGTQDFIKDYCLKQTDVTIEFILKKRNQGYTDSFNECLQYAYEQGCDVIFLINDDISFISTGWADKYIDAIQKTGIQHFHFMDGRNIVGRKVYNGITVSYHNWVRGCLEVLTAKAYQKVGGYDIQFHNHGCMDSDLSDRTILALLTDDTLLSLVEKNLTNHKYNILNVGFCADVDNIREFICDHHPNMGDIMEESNFCTKDIAFNILRQKRLENKLYKPDERKRLTILVYHQVSGGDAKVDPTSNVISNEMLQAHIQAIKLLGYEFINLHQLSDFAKLPNKSVLITFDDGYKNVYSNALPILQNEKISAAIFLTTNYIESKIIEGYDLLKHIIINYHFDTISSAYSDIILSDNNLRNSFDKKILCDQAALRFHFRSMLSKQKQLYIANLLCNKFNFEIDEDYTHNLYLTWNEIDRMKECFNFGSHTITHPLLSQLSIDEQENEIQGSKDILEANGLDISWFSYPYGYEKSFNNDTCYLLNKHGYVGAFTTSPAHNILPLTNMFSINRFMIRNENVWQLLEFIGF